jgi:hypothetical protein
MISTDYLKKITEDAECVLKSLRLIDPTFDEPAARVVQEVMETSQHLSEHVFGSSGALSPAEDLFREQEHVKQLALAYPSLDEFSGVLDPVRSLSERYRLPEASRTEELILRYRDSALSDVLDRYGDRSGELKNAMDAINTPWLDVLDPSHSVAGLAKLQGIGEMLERLPVFDDAVTKALRADLGDWRDPFDWNDALLNDPAARRDAYVDFGFDPSMTAFPAPAFHQGLEIARLRRDTATLADRYGSPVVLTDADHEEAASRTNDAHAMLFRLEFRFRQFIDATMTDSYGPDWPKARVPADVYNNWKDKRAKDKDSRGRLIDYADFTDYEKIVCRSDNWRDVFQYCFSHAKKESVRESFFRLYPIRLDTMHARPITQDDELLLYVEVKRLAQIFSSGGSGAIRRQ